MGWAWPVAQAVCATRRLDEEAGDDATMAPRPDGRPRLGRDRLCPGRTETPAGRTGRSGRAGWLSCVGYGRARRPDRARLGSHTGAGPVLRAPADGCVHPAGTGREPDGPGRVPQRPV